MRSMLSAIIGLCVVCGVGCIGAEETTSDQESVGEANVLDACPVQDGNCETSDIVNGACVYSPRAAGAVCGGSIENAEHGECDGVHPWCKWYDYTCKYAPSGALCLNGTCAQSECCQFCIDKTGGCVGVLQNGKPILGGGPCP